MTQSKDEDEKEYTTTFVNVHVGNMLMRAAATYDTLLKTVLEGVQNGIDAEADCIFVGFDLQGRVSVLADNGNGASEAKFTKALQTVGMSQKTRQQNKLGQFGLGLISPLDKCEAFEFISRPGPRSQIRAWTFMQRNIERSVFAPEIPVLKLSSMPSLDLFEDEARKLGKQWNTVVRMHKITNDRVVSRLTVEKLAEQIKQRFGDAMALNNTVCHIFIRDEQGQLRRGRVDPVAYKGERIDGSPFALTGDIVGKAGKVTIELYRAVEKNGKRRGVVKVSQGKGAIFGLALGKFIEQAKAELSYDTKESFEELNSGYFEGVIRAENLSLNDRRTEFKLDDEFLDLVIALDSWYDTVGRQFYQGEKDRTRNERYRDLTARSLREVQAILENNPDFERYVDGIRENVGTGLIGDGHGEKPSTGLDGDKTTRTRGKGNGVIRDRKPPTNRDGNGKTRDSDVPFGHVDKSGKHRAMVKNDSVGLWVEVTEFELSNDLWRFDADTGKLLFNCSNDVWAELDGASSETRHLYHNQWIVHLQKWVITNVLYMLQQPEDRREAVAELSRSSSSARLYADMCIKPNRAGLKI